MVGLCVKIGSGKEGKKEGKGYVSFINELSEPILPTLPKPTLFR